MHKTIVINKATVSRGKALRKIVASEYERQGYLATDDEELVHSPHYDGLFGVRFVAEKSDGDPIGTIALAIDSPQLLPMDALYHDELMVLREKGLQLGEVGQFAVTKELPLLKRMHIIQKLFAAIMKELGARDVDAVVIAVNPKHDQTYTLLGFSTFAAVKPYPAVSGALAVPKIKLLSREPAKGILSALTPLHHAPI
ncbi:MAG: hypothetical protein Q7S52_00580 [bacterium]|nr:hypothetical protein [bacterium]